MERADSLFYIWLRGNSDSEGVGGGSTGSRSQNSSETMSRFESHGAEAGNLELEDRKT